ncbi:MAG: family 43 glycosylhydrolase [Clostridiales bacterium]|nr:family 43 glycosylhydrolase [Clostridiales bacterium]
MPNPFLPLWEYIPDGEPRVFGDRVYLYGSHDKAGSESFCDFKLKVWSAPLNNLSQWECHGDSFHTKNDDDHVSDTSSWTGRELFAPDVIEYKGKYYLFAYIIGAVGCVAVSERPEGPFKLIAPYEYKNPDNCFGDGWFIDPGVLCDDDGQIYIYCGFESSFVAKVNPEKMNEIIDGSYQKDIIPVESPFEFFEGCSPRKIGDKYYLIYSPKKGSRLDYAISHSPLGPFEYKGTIIDNAIDHPGCNDHGSICNINGQWYVFYHRGTNGTIMSRRACVEKIEILPDGTIPQVEMTSLGFEDSLSPYRINPAEIACVLKNGCYITEKNVFTRCVTGIVAGSVIGYKYFEFGNDYSSKTMEVSFKVKGQGCYGNIKIVSDDIENGEELGVCEIGLDDGIYTARIKALTGRHAIYFIAGDSYTDWTADMFKGKRLFELEEFTFMK